MRRPVALKRYCPEGVRVYPFTESAPAKMIESPEGGWTPYAEAETAIGKAVIWGMQDGFRQAAALVRKGWTAEMLLERAGDERSSPAPDPTG